MRKARNNPAGWDPAQFLKDDPPIEDDEPMQDEEPIRDDEPMQDDELIQDDEPIPCREGEEEVSSI